AGARPRLRDPAILAAWLPGRVTARLAHLLREAPDRGLGSRARPSEEDGLVRRRVVGRSGFLDEESVRARGAGRSHALGLRGGADRKRHDVALARLELLESAA